MITLEVIQIILVGATILYSCGESMKGKWTRIGIVIGCAIIDVILSILGFAPYVDFVETGGELITEIAQNAVLLTCFFQ